MATRRRQRSRGSRLQRAPTAWLPIQDEDPNFIFPPGTLEVVKTMYDFTSSGDVGSKYGGGDWTLTRIHMSGGVVAKLGVAPPAGEGDKLVKVCFGVGMINVGGSVIGPIVSDLQSGDPTTDPQLSWMALLCCYVRLGQFEVSNCHIDIRSQRRIAQDGRLVVVAGIANAAGNDVPDTDPTNGTTITTAFNLRALAMQRGARL